MKKTFCLILFISIKCFSQNKEIIYVKINDSVNKELYMFQKTKNNKSGKIKILYFENKSIGFKKATKAKNNDEIIFIETTPNNHYYEFISIGTPQKVNNLKTIKYFNIIDISKHQVWNKKYPHTIIFIEKTNTDGYNLWSMNPVITE